jgi:hypothetical protein
LFFLPGVEEIVRGTGENYRAGKVH